MRFMAQIFCKSFPKRVDTFTNKVNPLRCLVVSSVLPPLLLVHSQNSFDIFKIQNTFILHSLKHTINIGLCTKVLTQNQIGKFGLFKLYMTILVNTCFFLHPSHCSMTHQTFITKTSPCNEDPLTPPPPHFNIKTGVNRGIHFFLILLQR